MIRNLISKCNIDRKKRDPVKFHIALSRNPSCQSHAKPPNSESLKLTLQQQLGVQQASRQITACDHDRANNPAPGSSEYHMIKH